MACDESPHAVQWIAGAKLFSAFVWQMKLPWVMPQYSQWSAGCVVRARGAAGMLAPVIGGGTRVAAGEFREREKGVVSARSGEGV